MMYMRIRTRNHFLLLVTSIWRYFYILEVKYICSASNSSNSGINTNIFALNNMKNDYSKTNIISSKSQFTKPKLYYPSIHSLKINNGTEPPSQNFIHNATIRKLEECINSSSMNLLSIDNIFNLISHLKKCKSMVKWIPSARRLERTLLQIYTQLTQTNSREIARESHHLQFLALFFFLKLYSIIRSCISFIKSVQSSSSGSHQCSIMPYIDNTTQLQHFHRMVRVYRESLQRLIRDPKCTGKNETHQQMQRELKNDSEERFRETLVSNFVVNSLSDLKVPHDPYKIFLSSYTQGGHTTMTPVIHISSSESPSFENMDDIPETKIYSVPFPTTNPSNTHHTSPSDSTDYYKLYPLPINPPPWYPSTNDYQNPSSINDLHLNFPSSDDSSFTGSIDNRDPVFIEPISVSSVDQLPTNYPIPLENASLSHNPMTVLVGARPPEIIVLQDFTFTEDDPVPPPAGAALPANSDGSIAADPAASAGSAGSGLSGGAAAAAIAAGAGAAGLGALGTAGIVGGAVAGGIGAGVAGAAGAASSDGAAGAGSTTAGVATSSLVGNDAIDLETIFSNFFEIINYVFSLEFLRTIGSTLYSLALPHISFLMSSGSTVLAFFFPWLYPDIIAPFANFFTNFD